MIYSAPSECIDTGKTWPVYTVRLRALGRRAYGLNIVRATSKGPLRARLYMYSKEYAHVYSHSCVYAYCSMSCLEGREFMNSERRFCTSIRRIHARHWTPMKRGRRVILENSQDIYIHIHDSGNVQCTCTDELYMGSLAY